MSLRLCGKYFLVSAWFGGGVHAVLGNFVDAARGRFLVDTVEMIERARAFSDSITLFDRFRHVRFREQHGFPQRAPAGKLRGNSRRERAS